MKLKAWLRLSCVISVILIFGSARAERPDSIANLPQSDTIPGYLVPGGVAQPAMMDIPASLLLDATPQMPQLNLSSSRDVPNLKLGGDLTPGIFSWQSGALGTSVASAAMPGMLGVESGRLNFRQNIGNVTFSLWGSATKYGYYRGMQTSWGFGGELDYKISNRWSLTLFGEYHTPVNAMTPGMAGYMTTSRFGGYASYNFNDHWGISVGAQTQRSIFTNGWDTQPIVMPYYRLNKDIKLGIDVGGIMYHMFRDYLNGRQNGGFANPTIGPINQGPPPVAPRR